MTKLNHTELEALGITFNKEMVIAVGRRLDGRLGSPNWAYSVYDNNNIDRGGCGYKTRNNAVIAANRNSVVKDIINRESA